jgi:hypothetical protein
MYDTWAAFNARTVSTVRRSAAICLESRDTPKSRGHCRSGADDILLCTGWRGAEKPFDQIGQRSYFAVSQFSGPTGNWKAGREGANKDGPVADRRTNVFAEGDKFFDQLLTFKRSPIHPVRDQDQAGNTVRGDSHRSYDLERADRCLEVQSGSRKWTKLAPGRLDLSIRTIPNILFQRASVYTLGASRSSWRSRRQETTGLYE